MRMPPLCVGMGIYLPMALTLLIPVGAFIGHYYEKWAGRQKNPEFVKRMGVLGATGFIVGESLFGVAFAGVVAVSGSDSPLAVVGNNFEKPGIVIGLLVFTGIIAWLYRSARQSSQTA
jgi:hypothetical protein